MNHVAIVSACRTPIGTIGVRDNVGLATLSDSLGRYTRDFHLSFVALDLLPSVLRQFPAAW